MQTSNYMANSRPLHYHLQSSQVNELSDRELVTDVASLLNQLWSLPASKRYVPCPNPRSLERENLGLLRSQPYWVSEKLDGVRMFLLFGFYESTTDGETEYAVFLDRSYRVHLVPVDAPDAVFQGTLLDGELQQQENGTYVYTVFDVYVYEGTALRHLPFEHRRATYETFVKSHLSPTQPGLTFVCKQWHDLSMCEVIWRQYQDVADGLIFQPRRGAPVQHGIQADVFKWKPAEHQTLDFYVTLLQNTATPTELAVLLECGDGPAIVPASHFNCSFVGKADVSQKRTVVECKLVAVDTRLGAAAPEFKFKAVKTRPDKSYANDARVVQSTLRAFLENITIYDLCGLL